LYGTSKSAESEDWQASRESEFPKMASRGKYFELIDFPKFARPTISTLQPALTAAELLERLGGGGFMSYNQIWPRVGHVVRGLATDAYILETFKAYKASWKNESIRDVVRLLRKYFGGRGTWYPEPSKPEFVLGFWFKPSIKGIWFFEGQAYAVLVNARKGQILSNEDVRFLARGIYELHCRNDPNDPIPLIVDLSEREKGTGRELRVFTVTEDDAISLELFEQSLKEFLVALNIAGISLPIPPELEDILSLFKKK
jgi:hypothetical protein